LRGRQKILRAATEVSVAGSEFRVDALLRLQAGVNIALEVVDSHDISGFKLLALLQEQFLVVRIDAKALRRAMQTVRPSTVDLMRMIREFGSWQSWPSIVEEPEQIALPFPVGTPRFLPGIAARTWDALVQSTRRVLRMAF
jgi:hypothetical protein